MQTKEETINILKKFHDAVLLEKWADFCINPKQYQDNGAPTQEFVNSQKLRHAIENAIAAMENN